MLWCVLMVSDAHANGASFDALSVKRLHHGSTTWPWSRAAPSREDSEEALAMPRTCTSAHRCIIEVLDPDRVFAACKAMGRTAPMLGLKR